MPTRQARGGSATALPPPPPPHWNRITHRGLWAGSPTSLSPRARESSPAQGMAARAVAPQFGAEVGRNVSPGTRVPPLIGRALFPAGTCGPDKQHRATPCSGLRSAQELSLHPLARPRLGVPSTLPLIPAFLSLSSPRRPNPPSFLHPPSSEPPVCKAAAPASRELPTLRVLSPPPPPSAWQPAPVPAPSLPQAFPQVPLTALWPGPSLSPAASRTRGSLALSDWS